MIVVSKSITILKMAILFAQMRALEHKLQELGIECLQPFGLLPQSHCCIYTLEAFMGGAHDKGWCSCVFRRT